MEENRNAEGTEERATGAEGEDASQAQPQGGTHGSAEPGRPDVEDILKELNRLGDAFVRAAQSAWNSEQRRQVEKDLSHGLTKLANTLEESLTRLSRSEQAKELKEQAERVVERVRQSKVTAELQEGLTQGLRTAADEMQKVARDMEARSAVKDDADEAGSAGQEPASGEAQDIPVKSADNEETRTV